MKIVPNLIMMKIIADMRKTGTMNIVVDGTGTPVTITIPILIAARAIIKNLSEMKARIRCNGYGTKGEIEIV